MNTPKLKGISRIVLIITGLLFFVSLMYPMWQIELAAPQYPEGLILYLHANKIAGDVDIINGLNHYIGMKTLHTDDFVEFKFLGYIIGGFGVLTMLIGITGRKKMLTILFILLVLFVMLAGIDFYRWNYDYGHNLDPNAAIRVPGMSYQPPILGYKQLLNFGAFSIPAIGGWILVGAGTIIFLLVMIENNVMRRLMKRKKNVSMIILVLTLVSCSNKGAEPIQLNNDKCSHCQMTIADGKFGSEVRTNKGRVYKFDDMICMVNYVHEQGNENFSSFYISDFLKNNQLVDATKASYVYSESLNSPMRGNFAAFESKQEAENYATKWNSSVENWNSVLND